MTVCLPRGLQWNTLLGSFISCMFVKFWRADPDTVWPVTSVRLLVRLCAGVHKCKMAGLCSAGYECDAIASGLAAFIKHAAHCATSICVRKQDEPRIPAFALTCNVDNAVLHKHASQTLQCENVFAASTTRHQLLHLHHLHVVCTTLGSCQCDESRGCMLHLRHMTRKIVGSLDFNAAAAAA